MKRKLSALLAFVMLLTGCAGQNTAVENSLGGSSAVTSTTAATSEAFGEETTPPATTTATAGGGAPEQAPTETTEPPAPAETTAAETTSAVTTAQTSAATEAPAVTTTQQTTTTAPATTTTTAATTTTAQTIPSQPTVITGRISSEEQLEGELAILKKGELLFAGKTDEGYYPATAPWLSKLDGGSVLALLYTCDEPTHNNWGILGWGATVKGSYVNGDGVNAAAFQPERTRLLVYSAEDIAEMFGASDISDVENINLGAWCGGRIAGLYLLQGSDAAELIAYEQTVELSRQIVHTYSGKLSNENATAEAAELYSYLRSAYGDCCITGQMESTWMGSPDYEMDYIKGITGKLPAIRGLDFMHNDFNGVAERAEKWWNDGGIVTICWHTGADFASGYNECLADDINWAEAFTEGTDTYNRLIAGMDRAVPSLQRLEDAGVPVLWRPFHEIDGGWFWWSKGGPENFVKLWQMMYTRYTDYWGLDNLIWVLGYSSNMASDRQDWYPGDEYVDLMGADSYTVGANGELYSRCTEIAPEGMPIVYHECANIPTEEELQAAKAEWTYFMVWHTTSLTDTSLNSEKNLKKIYNSDYFITLDELPDFH